MTACEKRCGIRRCEAAAVLLFLLLPLVPPVEGLIRAAARKRTFVVTRRMAEPATQDTAEAVTTTPRPSLLVSVLDRFGTDGTAPFGLVLASQSPRRREILDMMGLAGRYRARPSPLNETALQLELVQVETLPPVQYTERLAQAKAEALAREETVADSGNGSGRADRVTLYLGSDTIVDLNGTILEKPKDETDAKRMLSELSGRSHQVHTGVALYRLDPDGSVSLETSFVETADVTFAKLTERDIDAYVASGEPMDKAGSYGIQGIGGQLVDSLTGDFFTVMGLPMHRLSRALVDALQKEDE